MALYFHLQDAAVIAVTIYLACSGFLAHRRNTRSWDSLAARVGSGMFGRIFVAGLSQAVKANGIDEDFRAIITSRRGLWAVYKGAGVLLEMADYVERNCRSIDPAQLDSVRNDAMRSRVSALKALVFSV